MSDDVGKGEVHPLIEILKNSLHKKKLNRASYSLRAFARDLDIESSLLSKILRGKYVITDKMVRRLLEKLGCHLDEIAGVVKTARDLRVKRLYKKVHLAERVTDLSEKQMLLMRKWYWPALIELCQLPNFQGDPLWIAEKLKLSLEEVEETISTMIRDGFVVEEEGVIRPSIHQPSTFWKPGTMRELQDLQKDVLRKAIEAVDEVPPELRSQTTLTFRVSKSKLHLITNEIRDFNMRINKLAEISSDLPDSVYNMTVGLYPLTTEEEKS